ncbi:MAG: hypothetical protein MUE84_11590 [Hyphomonas sp.]|nr:hypothetical protein [Hyphomonas sp.]
MKHLLAASVLFAVAAPVATAAEINVSYGEAFAEKLTEDYGREALASNLQTGGR